MSKKLLATMIIALAVLVPTGVNLWQFYQGSASLEGKTVYRLPVTGYDPRDLARGRYVTLQIDWRTDKVSANCIRNGRVNNCGLCINKISKNKTAVMIIPNSAMTKDLCQMSFPDVYFSEGLNNYKTGQYPIMLRLYVSERIADKVDKTLRDPGQENRFTADVVFKDDGDAVLREFYVDDQPYQAYFAAH